MASLALGAVGAGVGSLFGAASIGWSIGSFIGGQLFGDKGQDIKGPRLSDRSVSTSAYGNIRPVIYGAYRVGGEIIWSTDLKEHKHKEEAGKGGGGGSYTSYTYTVNFAMALCKGPIIGVRKIWFDGKLIYSIADTATPAEIQVSDKIAKGIKVYTGSETQLADPTIEAALGAGNVPAYRGTAYMVFNTLDVTKYGNRIPQVTVEVVQDGSYSFSGDISTSTVSARQSLSLDKGIATVHNWEYTYAGGDTDGLYEVRRYSLADGSLLSTDRYFAVSGGDETWGVRFLYQMSISPSQKYAIAEVGDIGTGNNSRYYLGQVIEGRIFPITELAMATDLDNFKNGSGVEYNIIWEDDLNIWFYKANSGDIYHYTITVTALGTVIVTAESFNVDPTREGTDTTDRGGTFCLDRATGEFYVEILPLDSSDPSIKRISRDGELIEEKFVGIALSGLSGRLMAFSHGVLYEVIGLFLNAYNWDTEELITTKQIATTTLNIDGAIMEASGNLVTLLANGTIYNYYRSLSLGSIGLHECVSDICESVGIETSEIDVSDLASDTVRGFMIANQNAARGALEQLSSAYFFDGRESDGVLEFIKRGDTAYVTLSDDDIGCYEGNDIAELMDTERTQEEELPRALTLNYANSGADYQIGAQHSLRQSVLNGTEATIQLPIVFSDSEAKVIVDKMMFVAWQNRHKFTLNTWQKYHKIDPADVISARDETMRVIARDEGVNGLLQLTCVRELPYIYTGQVGTGATSGHASQSVAIGGPTNSVLLDVPPLRDADINSYGMYWATAGYFADWPGAALFRSPDGQTFNYLYQNSNESVIGQATTVLGDFQGGNIFDELNIVRVNVNGVLETKTRTEVLGGANVAVIGDELIQFRTATLVSTGIYDLSGLLRGRMGTEWAIDAHDDYETFVLLSETSVRFIELPSTDYNVSRIYGVVTSGETLEDIQTENKTYTGQNIKPLSPVHLGGGKTTHDGSWSLQWVRRSRYGWQWVDSRDVLSDEATESYEVAILNNGEIVRTLTSTTDSATYTLDQQAEDFGGAQGTLDFKVRQTGELRNGEWSEVATISSGMTTTTKLLLHTDGVEDSTNIVDVYGNTITVSGDAKTDTDISKFADSSSIVFDVSGDYLSILGGGNIVFSGDLTIEGWIYTTSVAGGYFGILHLDSQILIARKGSTIVLWYGSDQCTSSTIAVNTWYHVAVTRASGTWRLFVAGTKAATDWSDSTTWGPVDTYIGKYLTGYWSGNIDQNFRIKIGEALYTADFTPPTVPFQG